MLWILIIHSIFPGNRFFSVRLFYPKCCGIVFDKLKPEESALICYTLIDSYHQLYSVEAKTCQLFLFQIPVYCSWSTHTQIYYYFHQHSWREKLTSSNTSILPILHNSKPKSCTKQPILGLPIICLYFLSDQQSLWLVASIQTTRNPCSSHESTTLATTI